MFKRLRHLFPQTRRFELSLEFELDVNAQGKQVAFAYAPIAGDKQIIRNPARAGAYGYTLTCDHIRYTITLESLTALQSLLSATPEIHDDGAMVFDVAPRILAYLRSKKGLKESDHSQQITIEDSLVIPSARIDYFPDSGLVVQAGYNIDKDKPLIPVEQLQTTADGNYARFGNTFMQVLDVVDPAVKALLKNPLQSIPISKVPEFIEGELEKLKQTIPTFLSPSAERIRIINKEFKPCISVDVAPDGRLDLKIDYAIDNHHLSHAASIKTDTNHIRIDTETWIRIDKNRVEQTGTLLSHAETEQTERGFSIPACQFFSIEKMADTLGATTNFSETYRQFLHEITAFESSNTFVLPAEMEATLSKSGIALRPYQRAGIHWMTWLIQRYLHGILADDMGLGKTIQMVCAIGLSYAQQQSSSHSLIVCPKSVVRFWSREIRRCLPNIGIYEYTGPERDRKQWHKKETTVFISTYETLTRDLDEISDIQLHFLVLDEATKIKNPDAKRSKAMKAIHATHRIALTGTPIENRPAELWSLFDFLMKGYLGTYGGFARQFEDPIVTGSDRAAESLARRIHPFILRRVKETVAADLPDKIDIDEWCELTDEQKAIYAEMQQRLVNPIRNSLLKGKKVSYATSILPLLTKLKQLCDHPAQVGVTGEAIEGRSNKFDRCMEKIEEISETGDHVVVFSHFLSALDLFEEAFARRGFSHIRLDGSTNDRQTIIDKFNKGNVVGALCSIQACGQGISLTAANHVIHFDRWWNPAVEDQATDRVHRIGQVKTVFVHRILTINSIEERIAVLLEKKRDIFERVIGAATKQTMAWTREELLELLEPLT